jgi:sulfonate transport system substrate-binding protein
MPLRSRPPARRRPRPGSLLLALTLLAAPLAAGCGGDGAGGAGGTGGGSAGAPTGNDEVPPGVTLRVGEQNPEGELSFELAGLNDDLPYRIEYVRFASGPLTNEGFAAGAIDIGTLGDTPVVGAAARDLPVSVLAVTDTDGPGSLLVAGPGSGIETLEDLAGRTVAFTTGTAQHGLVLRALDSVGLSQADVEQVDVPLQDLPSVLESGAADASVISYEAEVKYARAHPGAVRLTSAADLPGAGGYTLVADAAIEDEAKAAAVFDYLERRVRANEWIQDHPDEWAQEFYVEERHQTPEDARLVLEGTGTKAYVPITAESQQSHQDLADLLHEAGGLDAPADLGRVYDPEVAERANAVVAAAAPA